MANQGIQIKTALISVYHKDHLDNILTELKRLGVELISTGGTAGYLAEKGYPVTRVEDLTGYPGILGGRVKTLHPLVFGGILGRSQNEQDAAERLQYGIPVIDLVMVDLYPFEDTVRSGATHAEIIEKIDIGGISLIRAAAKNYHDVLIVSSREDYPGLLDLLVKQNGMTTLEQRKAFAARAFAVSSHYDTGIWSYFDEGQDDMLKMSLMKPVTLRYGENPHQQGRFFGDLHALFDQLHGKELSYNNLLDVDAALWLIDEFEEPALAILKHNNACGMACRETLAEAWKAALAGDPVSAFGGIVVTNRVIDLAAAKEMDQIFFEIALAPGFDADALDVLKKKKNRILLARKQTALPESQFRSLLNGVLWQDRDQGREREEDLNVVTATRPTESEVKDLLFANILVKHTKSNAIVLVKNRQLIGSGTGQTSRVDALKQAIVKAREFNLDLEGAVMASDAFFPFKDSVEIAFEAGIRAVIQPGGSIRDQESIDFCNMAGMSMVFTGTRHFKH